MKNHSISTLYFFKTISDVTHFKSRLETYAQQLGVKGLIILATEGFNATLSHPSREILNQFIDFIKLDRKLPEITVKNSQATQTPFRRFKVKVRPEIVTLKTPDLFPQGKNHHLTPDEWNHVLKNEKDFVLIDTRNWYETRIGSFRGAIKPPIEQFTEFPEFVEKQNIPKSQKLLIFCTGGIRCEKGLLDLNRRGYQNVYQLEGGILKYLEEHPHEEFEGECFVFDHRVAVDQDLQPSQRYALCPHDGQPADQKIICARCGTEKLISQESVQDPIKGKSCSKHCAYRLSVKPDEKGPPQNLSSTSSF